MNQPKHIVVLGRGVAGAAIAHVLSRDYQVTVVFRRADEGSTFTNQKWKHSGLLYPNRALARTMWTAYKRMDRVLERPFIMKPQARFLALKDETLREKANRWREWGVRSWALDVEPLAKWEYLSVGELGHTKAVGGFSGPDCVVDFPELVRNLAHCAEQNGARFFGGASAQRLIHDGKRVAGIEYKLHDERLTLDCDLCVVAMGAWSPRLLRNSNVVSKSSSEEVPIILKKCLVLAYEGELVPCITVCLDVREGPFPDAALVPFKGTTLAAGTDFDETDDPDDNSFKPQLVEELRHELARCFPALSKYVPSARVCFKAEQRSGNMAPNVGYQIYDDFSVDGLIVAIPGKASLMFQLASAVAGRVHGIIG